MFCNPGSPAAPAKLRLVYECAPLSLIVEVRGQLGAAGVALLWEVSVAVSDGRGEGPAWGHVMAPVFEHASLSLTVEVKGQLGAAGVACDSTGVSVCAPAVACSPPPSFACYADVQAAVACRMTVTVQYWIRSSTPPPRGP